MAKAQWEKRLDLTIVIYQHLLLEQPKDELLSNALDIYGLDNDAIKVLDYIFNHEKELVDKITPLLNQTWTWSRMSFFDRAIILESLAEVEVLQTPKPIIIDQALITAKKYNIDDSYKYINPLLDKLIK